MHVTDASGTEQNVTL